MGKLLVCVSIMSQLKHETANETHNTILRNHNIYPTYVFEM